MITDVCCTVPARSGRLPTTSGSIPTVGRGSASPASEARPPRRVHQRAGPRSAAPRSERLPAPAGPRGGRGCGRARGLDRIGEGAVFSALARRTVSEGHAHFHLHSHHPFSVQGAHAATTDHPAPGRSHVQPGFLPRQRICTAEESGEVDEADETGRLPLVVVVEPDQYKGYAGADERPFREGRAVGDPDHCGLKETHRLIARPRVNAGKPGTDEKNSGDDDEQRSAHG